MQVYEQALPKKKLPSLYIWLECFPAVISDFQGRKRIFCLGAIQNQIQSIQTTFVKGTIKAIFNVQQTINLHV